MKKTLLVLIGFIISFCFINVVHADNCSNVDFEHLECNLSVGGVIGIGSKSCKDSGLTPQRAYEHSYTVSGSKVTLHGVCYYSPKEKGYFYAVYHDNGKKCLLADKAFAQNNSKNADKLITKSSDRIFVSVGSSLSETSGCVPYFYVSDDKKTTNFTYYAPGTYDWQDEKDLGDITIDNVSLDKMKTCIKNNFYSDKFCSTKDTETIAKGCIVEAGYSADLFDKYKNELTSFASSSEMSNVALYCHLKDKCSISKENFDKYINAKKTYSGLTTQAALEKVMPGNTTLINCIVQNEGSKEVEEEQKQIEEDIATATTDKLTETQTAINNYKQYGTGKAPKVPSPEFPGTKDCESILGKNLTQIVKASIRIMQILGAIIAIVMGMIKLRPAIMSKDADGLKAASKSLVLMAIILVIIFLFPEFLKLIGNIFKFDTSCIV